MTNSDLAHSSMWHEKVLTIYINRSLLITCSAAVGTLLVEYSSAYLPLFREIEMLVTMFTVEISSLAGIFVKPPSARLGADSSTELTELQTGIKIMAFTRPFIKHDLPS